MTNDALIKIFEHNNWANQKVLEVCLTLNDAQLDAPPQSATEGSIRSTLVHLVGSQSGYLQLLTLPVAERVRETPALAEMQDSLIKSGAGLLALLKDDSTVFAPKLETRDGYWVEPWVILVQIINHATEHREQIKSMLTAMGITPPEIDGWDYGFETKALAPMNP